MATLTMNNKQYEIEKLTPEAKAKLDSAHFCDKKLQQLQAELAVVRTARTTYLQSLSAMLSDEALISDHTDEQIGVVDNQGGIKKPEATKH